MERTDRGSDRGNDITPADGTQTQSGRRAQTYTGTAGREYSPERGESGGRF